MRYTLFSRDRGITKGAYSGFVLVSTLVLFALTAIVILSGDPVLFDTLQQILLFSAMAISYDYFSGYTGYYNLGFGAFIALGGYVFTFASVAGYPLPVGVVLGGLTSTGFAVLISYPFFRLRGGYFAIATLSLVLLIQTFFNNFYQYTGGTAGIILPFSTFPLRVPLMVSSLLLVIATLYLHNRIRGSRLGLALRSIKEDERVAESFGANAFRFKQYALLISAFFGGLSGALFAIYLGFVSSQSIMGLSIDFFPVVASLLGGSGIFLGPLLGSFILAYTNLNLPPLINSFFPRVTAGPLLVTGGILLTVGLFMPGGILNTRYFKGYANMQADAAIVRRIKR